MKMESGTNNDKEAAAEGVTFQGLKERLAALEKVCEVKRAKADGKRLARGGAKRRTPLWLD
jgi:hypothetical protein